MRETVGLCLNSNLVLPSLDGNPFQYCLDPAEESLVGLSMGVAKSQR